MRKSLISLYCLSLLGSVHAACDSAVSFSGAFGGLGAVVSFDKDYLIGETIENPGSQCTYKKSKTAFGGQIVLGYGHQFDNNLYLAIMHESNFLSKAERQMVIKQNWANISRKVWVPSFGIAAGYIIDDINVGIRGGISLNKFKYEHDFSHLYGVDKSKNANKTLTETSPYVGVYVEKKFGDFVGYMNVDHVFKKQKFAHDTKYKDNSNDKTNHTEHKRPSWKVAVGVKYNLPIF